MPSVGGGGTFVSLFFTCVCGTWKTVLNFSGTCRVRLISLLSLLLLLMLLLLLLLTRWRRRRWRAARRMRQTRFGRRPRARTPGAGGERRFRGRRPRSVCFKTRTTTDTTLFHRKRTCTITVGHNTIVRKENDVKKRRKENDERLDPLSNKLKTVRRRRLTHITDPGSNAVAPQPPPPPPPPSWERTPLSSYGPWPHSWWPGPPGRPFRCGNSWAEEKR